MSIKVSAQDRADTISVSTDKSAPQSPPPAAPVAAPEAQPTIEDRLAHLAKKEEANFAQLQELKDLKTKMESGQLMSAEQWQKAFVESQPTPDEPLDEMGQLKAKLQELESFNQQFTQSLEEKYKAQTDSLVDTVLSAKSQEFPLIQGAEANDLVRDLINERMADEGVSIGVEEAAKEVEDYLLELAVKLVQTDKVQQKLQAARADTPNPAKTISQSMVTTRKHTPEERAMLVLEGRSNEIIR